MDNLFTQIANADSFTYGAWMLYGFSALGVVLAFWVLVRKVSNLVVKALLMSVVVFVSFALAKVTFESGDTLWVPALPFFGVDVAFQGMKYFDQLIPYLVISASASLVLCALVAVIGRKVFDTKKTMTAKEQGSDESNQDDS